MNKSLALVIDDEPDIRELLAITLGRMGVDADSVANLNDARQRVTTKQYDLCLTDMRLPDGDGIDFVRQVQRDHPNLPIAVITAHGNMDVAIEAMKAGAFDFISKPVELEDLRKITSTALKLRESPQDQDSSQLLGESPIFQDLKKKIRKLARSQAPVYIRGESGTGKELVARAIHDQGPRAKEAFVPVNCGAIPGELMEAEFFGHVKGSFTGATGDKRGLFQAADGGTLFLDEVADLPLDMQVKLLRAIQEKAVRPVGAPTEEKIDVRILSATHQDLEGEIREGRFRNDLFYRINVIQLDIPALRQRPEDIAVLAEHFLQRFGDASPPRLSKSALRALEQYPFPGNIRELENILERACTLCDSNTIEASDLQLPSPRRAPGDQFSYSPHTGSASLDEFLGEVERDIITRTLHETRWNRTAAARRLGVSFRSLRYRLKKLGLDGD